VCFVFIEGVYFWRVYVFYCLCLFLVCLCVLSLYVCVVFLLFVCDCVCCV